VKSEAGYESWYAKQNAVYFSFFSFAVVACLAGYRQWGRAGSKGQRLCRSGFAYIGASGYKPSIEHGRTYSGFP
jgi:hypothetical protein